MEPKRNWYQFKRFWIIGSIITFVYIGSLLSPEKTPQTTTLNNSASAINSLAKLGINPDSVKVDHSEDKTKTHSRKY